MILKVSQSFSGKHLWQIIFFFNKVVGWGLSTLTLHQEIQFKKKNVIPSKCSLIDEYRLLFLGNLSSDYIPTILWKMFETNLWNRLNRTLYLEFIYCFFLSFLVKWSKFWFLLSKLRWTFSAFSFNFLDFQYSCSKSFGNLVGNMYTYFLVWIHLTFGESQAVKK